MVQFQFLIRLFSFYLIVIGSYTQLAQATPAKSPDFRLVVTGGLFALHGGDQAFYGSPLFRLGDIGDPELGSFVIQNAQLKVYRARDSLYFSFQSFEPSLLVALANAPKSTRSAGLVQGLMSPQSYGFALSSDAGSLEDFVDTLLTRELGGIRGQFKWEMRQLGDVQVLAIDISDPEIGVYWPKSSTEIKESNAVVGAYPDVDKRFVFFPRQLASTPRTFGIVDKLMAKQDSVPTRYVDVGNALTSNDNESIEGAKNMTELLMARKPAVLGSARYDLGVLFKGDDFASQSPYVVAVKGKSSFPASRTVALGTQKIQFSALGELSEAAAGFLPKGVESLSVRDSIKQAQLDVAKSKAGVVIGIADNAYSASEAIESPVFDAVLSLVSGRQGALPARDEIDLALNHREGLRSVAPLIRISSEEVTEVSVWVNPEGQVTRIVLSRHPIIDEGPEAQDAKRYIDDEREAQQVAAYGLPQRPDLGSSKAWTQQDLNDTLGGLLLAAKPGTELAIIDQQQAATPIYSPVPLTLAEQLLQRSGRAVWLSLRGKYIKRIIKASKEGQFDVPIVLVGGSLKGPTINKREIADAEDYSVVATEKVLLAVSSFMEREGLFAQSSLAATAVQTSLLEANKEPLKILSELRRRDTKDETKIGETRDLLSNSQPVAKLVHNSLASGLSEAQLTQMLKYGSGKARPTLTFEISDLDVGLKANIVDDTLSGWQKFGGTPGNKGSFTEPRFWDPNFLNMLIYAKVALKYSNSLFDVDFTASEKFFQPYSESKEIDDEHRRIFEKKPEDITAADYKTLGKLYQKLRPVKDATKLDLEIRVPLSRVMNNAPLADWGFGPIVKYTFETQLWPNVFMSSIPSHLWPHRVLDSRLLLGVSAKPTTGDELFHVGALLGYDFSRDSAVQSFAYGAEIAGAGRWNISVFNIRLESSLRKLFPVVTPEEGRMGMVWLTDGRVELPIYGGFSVSAVANLTVGEQMHEAFKFGSSMVFGFAISYGNRFKWLL